MDCLNQIPPTGFLCLKNLIKSLFEWLSSIQFSRTGWCSSSSTYLHDLIIFMPDMVQTRKPAQHSLSCQVFALVIESSQHDHIKSSSYYHSFCDDLACFGVL